MNEFNFIFDISSKESRIDHYLVAKLETFSRTRIQNLIKEGSITVNGLETKANYKLRAGDEIAGTIPDIREFKLVPEDIPLDIVFEDDYLLVINKPAGMVVHPAIGNFKGTLLNGLLFYLQQNSSQTLNKRPGLIHRLDKDTSGLLMAAKDEEILNIMQAQLKERRIKREYQALVWGHLKEPRGKLDLPIGRSPTDRRKMAVIDRNSRQALTNYSLITRYKFADHITAKLQTGRTHQIRVHFSHLRHPVIGDREYGGDESVLSGLFDQYRNEARHILKIMPRQSLHACKLEFKHPKRGLIYSFKSDLPDDMMAVLNYLIEIESME
jgi:23S rRNA pseudouridine1911/1915/1917 synthase